MRAAELVFAVAFVVAVLWGIRLLVIAGARKAEKLKEAKRAQAIHQASWSPHHESVGSLERVVARRVAVVDNDEIVLDEHEIATIPTDADDYDERFLFAMSAARARAALQNSENEN